MNFQSGHDYSCIRQSKRFYIKIIRKCKLVLVFACMLPIPDISIHILPYFEFWGGRRNWFSFLKGENVSFVNEGQIKEKGISFV